MPNAPVQAAAGGLPYDNRDPRTKYLDDIRSLARMASITQSLVEDAHRLNRAVKKEDDIYTFKFSESWLDDIDFAVGNVFERAALLLANRSIIDPEDEG